MLALVFPFAVLLVEGRLVATLPLGLGLVPPFFCASAAIVNNPKQITSKKYLTTCFFIAFIISAINIMQLIYHRLFLLHQDQILSHYQKRLLNQVRIFASML